MKTSCAQWVVIVAPTLNHSWRRAPHQITTKTVLEKRDGEADDRHLEHHDTLVNVVDVSEFYDTVQNDSSSFINAFLGLCIDV